MLKNKTPEKLKVTLADSGWSSEFKVDEYGMSVRLIKPNGELGSFTRFQPHDVAAILEFLEEQVQRWDKDEI